MATTGLAVMNLRLWLVRHGVTDWKDAGRFTGWTDVPLNEQGRQQAEQLAARLAGIEFAGIWSSDLDRAVQTARLAVGWAVPDYRLRELNFGDLEGLAWQECPADAQQALMEFDGFQAPGGESVPQLRQRVLDFLAALPDGDHLLFTHGGVIRLIRREAGCDGYLPPGGLVHVPWPPSDFDP